MGSQNQERPADDVHHDSVPFFESNIYFFEIPQWRTEIHKAQAWDLTDYGMAKIRVYGSRKTCSCTLKFDVNGSELGESRILAYPSSALQPVVDSKRYFVLKLLWIQTGKVEDIGICFYERGQSKEFLSLLNYHLPTAEELHDLKEETESSRSGGSSSNSAQSWQKPLTPLPSTTDSGIERDLITRFSTLGFFSTTTTVKEPQKQKVIVSTTEEIKPKENLISEVHQTIPVIPRTRVHSQTRIIKEELNEDIVFFDYHYPELRIITKNYSQINSDTLKELRKLAPRKLIRPRLKTQSLMKLKT